MKKIFNILFLVALFACVMPMRTLADTKKDSFSTTFGTIDWEIKDESTETKSKTWVFYITPNDNYKSLQAELAPTNLTNLNPVASSNFLIADKKDETGGRVMLTLVVNNPTGLQKGVKTEIMTVTTNYTSTENCTLALSLGTISCQQIGSLYIDNNGASVSEEDYKKACGTSEPEKPDNPQTGSVIPYIAVGGGMIAIAGVYLYSRKSNKIYKI